MHPMLNIAVRAARAAGNQILRYVDRLDTLNVSTKQRNEFFSEVDQLAEQEIIKVLRKFYPDHAILAEESGAQGSNDDYTWIIDPLDGTTNFLHGFPQFAVSIGLQHRGQIEQGVIYDPLRNELFTATRGSGVHMNDRRLRISRKEGLEGALLGPASPFAISTTWRPTSPCFVISSPLQPVFGGRELPRSILPMWRQDGSMASGRSA